MRVVVDTNVMVSGLITPSGSASLMITALLGGRFEPILSPDLAFELLSVLGRPKFMAYRLDQRRVTAILALFGKLTTGVDPPTAQRDPADWIVAEAAVSGGAGVIVTGDRDLLDDVDLRAWLLARGIEVTTPAELMRRLDS